MGKYVYGIIDSGQRESFGTIGVGDSEVYSVQFEDLGAVVSDIVEDCKIGVEEARVHDEALRKIMQPHAVIPMSFGTVAKNEEEVKNILKCGQIELKKTLEKVHNRVQINIQISWDKFIFGSILSENQEIQELAREAQNNTSLSLKIELGRKTKSALDKKKSEYLAEIECTLRRLTCESEENKVNDPDTLMNAAFLVGKDKENEFYGALSMLEHKYQGRLKFTSLGPLPPYNFAKLVVKKIDFDAVEEARKTLGLSQEVSISTINSAYNRLVMQCHPDLYPNDDKAAEMFKKIKNAQSLLTKYCEHYLCSLQKTRVEETILIEENGA
jgi:DnaJ-domain-containing protein 1